VASEKVELNAIRTCGKLTFDSGDQALRFANYQVPHGARYPFPAAILWTKESYKEAFLTLGKIFYLPQKKGEPVKVDERKAREGVIVEALFVDGPRAPYIAKNPKSGEYSYFSLRKAYAVQILSLKEIEPTSCHPLEE
jgi:hypothetical protein